MTLLKFPDKFIFGAATSSYQIEGAWNEGGKGLSIWDTFSHKPGNITNNENGDVACDHYHRYKEDVSIMKAMNLNGYRFSISWPRIFPSGIGKVSMEGVQFYDNLINELLSVDIEPNISLYHWDLPEALSKQGGWINRQIVDHFVKYAEFCFDRFGDRVKKWTTFNESYIVAHLGYGVGVFAPGIKDPKSASRVSHHLHLAHAITVERFRKMKLEGKIGIVHCLSPVHDMDKTESGSRKAMFVDGTWNRWFLDPSLKGEYPEDMMALRKKEGTAPEILNGDMDLIKNNRSDFLGINYYFRFRVFDNGAEKPFNWAECVNIKAAPGAIITDIGWEVYPQGIYEILKRIDAQYDKIPLYIMENGMAAADTDISKGEVRDDDRVEYIKLHLEMCKRAIDEGVDLRGYYYWSLMDNFEWVQGYAKKFGLIRVDYSTLKRTVKKSGKWYGEFIKNQRE